AQLFEGVRYINLIKEGKETLNQNDLETFKNTFNSFIIEVLGLNIDENATNSNSGNKLSGVVEMLIEMRNDARANKNWALSDEIRDRLLELGIQLKDGKEGTTFSVN
ncbi:MAG: cysteine--tRNA ligase, partial [Flavobacteriaceae bacterium]|nr:cysteine--tRNA ligase [Flavobacteriaceae bacterium]